jgi:hypothetical protein
MKTSESITNISPALLEAQKGMGHPPKTAKSRFGKIADLVGTIDHVKAVFLEQGLVFVQSTGGRVQDGVQIATITTRVIHAESGEWIEDTVEELIVPNKANSISQIMGCADTYHRRYQIYAFAFVQGENDTDGEREGKGGDVKAASPDSDFDL